MVKTLQNKVADFTQQIKKTENDSLKKDVSKYIRLKKYFGVEKADRIIETEVTAERERKRKIRKREVKR